MLWVIDHVEPKIESAFGVFRRAHASVEVDRIGDEA
jgi:hypothetical protein